MFPTDLQVHDPTNGFWGHVTASRDWCEPNYAVTPYIAEFWNTISNLLYILFAINLWRIKRNLDRTVPQFHHFQSLNVFISGLFVLGFASGSFHGTLKYWPQIFDRVVSMLHLRHFCPFQRISYYLIGCNFAILLISHLAADWYPNGIRWISSRH